MTKAKTKPKVETLEIEEVKIQEEETKEVQTRVITFEQAIFEELRVINTQLAELRNMIQSSQGPILPKPE